MLNLLLRLLGARAEDAVNIAKAEFAFRGGIKPGWLFLLFALLGFAAWLSYKRAPLMLSPGRRYLLTGLRIAFFGLLVALLLRPVLELTIEGRVRRAVAVLIDASASMQIKDPRLATEDRKRATIAFASQHKGEPAARIEVAKASLKNIDLLPRLERNFDVQFFSFGQKLQSLTPATNALDQLSATNSVTAIGDGLREIVNRTRGQSLAGIVLVTDGQNNGGLPLPDAATMLKAERVPVYAYGVGVNLPRDVAVAGLFAPEVTFAQDEVPVTVRLIAHALKGEKVSAGVKLDGQVVASKTHAITNDGEQVVSFKFTPQRAGEFDLEAFVEPAANEAIRENNARAQRLRVVDSKMKVLLIDQSPRWEFRYLQAMLLRDRRVELKCLLFDADPTVARADKSPYLERFPVSREELFKYDVVIFGDVDPKAISPNQLEMLRQLTSDFGSAFVLVAGWRFAPNAYRGTVLEKMLSVELAAPSFEPPEVRARPIQLELTSRGRDSIMLRLAEDEESNVRLWKNLPPIYWAGRVSRAKPAAEVLLVDPDPVRETRSGKMPVLALQQYGMGQTLYVGTDNIWRWRQNAGDSHYTAFWGQILQRLALPRLLGTSKRTQLMTERQSYFTGDRVSIFARLYGPGFEPIALPSLKGSYSIDQGETSDDVMLRKMPEQPALFRGEFIAPRAGRYRFWVEHDPSVILDFTVSDPRFEFGESAMNESGLKNLAAITGGAFFREENLHQLPENIARKTEPVRSSTQVELWSSPLYFLAMLSVVSVEWLLRKRSFLK